KQNKGFGVKAGFEKHPVIFVSWYGSKAYCEWKGGNLPSEAQWEYAAGGGVKSQGFQFSGSNDLDEVGWYEGNSGGKLHPVGQKKPNELGIYDMSGNVLEWCRDVYEEDFYRRPEARQRNPLNNNYGISSRRVVRGGSWDFLDGSAARSFRYLIHYNSRINILGFRLVRRVSNL
ncbi:MAG: formylglycine-generating enzyme family protein, partial [Bacteroidota bacterium]